jgi:regulator of protease activity HflC (stomatin/prohibitin superfamily)
MRKIKNLTGLFAVLAAISMTSCQSVDSTNRGVEVSWGGETNMNKVYPSGMTYGLKWLTDDLIEYNVTQQTITEKFDFNDKNSMSTGVEISVDFSLDEAKLPYLHTKISDWKAKLHSTMKGAAKEVIPQYSAVELNLSKREEAENKLAAILKKELPDFYLVFDRIRVTDVDLPTAVSQTAELSAKQEELNKLADKKKTEAENNYHAAEWDAKTKDILSQPAMLKLKELEIDMEYAKRGVSKYGNNNVFGNTNGILLNR